MIKLTCLKCNGNNFSAKAIKIVHGNKEIKSVAWVCDDCSEPLMDSEQMQDTLEQYERIEKLESSKEEDKSKPQKSNEDWGIRKKWKPDQKHPWKRQAFKTSIDNHVLNK